MRKIAKVNILGTVYDVLEQTVEENSKLETANGICELYSKKIVVCDIPKNNPMIFENAEQLQNKVLRHEIIHAFFAESGLRGESDYAENEELVDWIAIQFPKIANVFNQLGIC